MFCHVVVERIRCLHPLVRSNSCCRHVAAFQCLIVALRCRKVGSCQASYFIDYGVYNRGNHRRMVLRAAR